MKNQSLCCIAIGLLLPCPPVQAIQKAASEEKYCIFVMQEIIYIPATFVVVHPGVARHP